MRALFVQLTRFGLVGLVGLVIDVAIFNLLIFTVLSADSLHEGPIIAKLISTSFAIVANWLGNRHWTFRAVRRPQWWREGLEFAVASLIGMGVSLGCLWVSHYALGFTSPLADNIATNVVGLGLGTAVRFTLYRLWVFKDVALAPGDTHVAPVPNADTSGTDTSGIAVAESTR